MWPHLQVVPDAGGLKQVASPFDEGVAKSILPRLDWAALRKTAAEVSPPLPPAAAAQDPSPSRWRFPRHRLGLRLSVSLPPAGHSRLPPAGHSRLPSHVSRLPDPSPPLAQLGVAALPEEVPAGAESDAGFLRSVYALVFDIHLEEGNLLCPHCGRAYPVRKGVPNMLLRDDEM